jgi:hypothetical protein
LKEEFMRATGALYTVLYKDPKAAQHVLEGVIPQGPHKVESVVRMAVQITYQINAKIQFLKVAPQILLPFAKDVAEEIMHMVSEVKGIQFTPQEHTAIAGSVAEICLRTTGVKKSHMQALLHVIPRSQIMQGKADYEKARDFSKGAGGPSHPDHPANAQAGGAPPAGGPPQGGPPQGGTPPGPGAPVTAAPGPGQSAPPGGMLSQTQPPQGG